MKVKQERWLWALIMAFALTSIGSLGFAEEKKPSEAKVAVVNGTVITRVAFNREVDRIQMQASKKGTNLTDAKLLEIKKAILENLITQELIYQESQKIGIKISENEVDENLMSMKKRFPSEAVFDKALKSANFSEAQLKTQIKRGMAAEQFIKGRFVQKIEISEKQIKSYYEGHPKLFNQSEQVQASHILIKVDPQANESQKAEARKKLEEIQKKVQKGEDFAHLAKEFSQGPSSKKGGDLGYFKRGQMVKPFDEVAFTLKPGEVSDIVKTRFGYHLIKVINKKPAKTTPYEEIKDKIEQYLKRQEAQKILKSQEVQKMIKSYVEKLKENATIERFLTKGP